MLKDNKIFIEDFLRKIDKVEKIEDISLASGVAGYILILTNLYYYTKSESFIQIIKRLIESIDVNEIELTPSNMGLWTGPLGLSFALSKLNEVYFDDQIKSYNNEIYLQIRPILIYWATLGPNKLNIDYKFDLLFGISGVFEYIVTTKWIKKDPLLFELYNEQIDKILNCTPNEILSVRKRSGNNFFPNELILGEDFFYNISIAHGALGFCVSLFKLRYLFPNQKERIETFIYSISNILEKNVFTDKNLEQKTFPNIISINDYESYSIQNIRKNVNYSWCNGMVGLIIYAKQCGKNLYFSNLFSSLRKSTDDLLLNINHKKYYQNLCMCHGHAGNIYCVFRYENIKKYKRNQFVKYLSNNYLTKEIPVDADSFSLLDGYGGVLLINLSLLYNKPFIGDNILGY